MGNGGLKEFPKHCVDLDDTGDSIVLWELMKVAKAHDKAAFMLTLKKILTSSPS